MNKKFKERVDKCYRHGKKIEFVFKECAINSGIDCFVTTPEEDINEHLDVRINKPPEINNWYLDVKSRKPDAEEIDCTWVELKNVGFEDGWLYAPKLKAIAFQIDNEFWIVDIVKLRELVEINLKSGYYFGSSGKKLLINNRKYYTKYQRTGRGDEIVLVPLKDIEPYIIMKLNIEYEKINCLRL